MSRSPILRRLALAICLLQASAGGAMAGDAESAFRGRRLAEANCAECHAIALHDGSSNPAAPPFRHLVHRMSLEDLRTGLAGDLFRRHPEMPDFEPTREQVNDIVDFIESIRR